MNDELKTYVRRASEHERRKENRARWRKGRHGVSVRFDDKKDKRSS